MQKPLDNDPEAFLYHDIKQPDKNYFTFGLINLKTNTPWNPLIST